MTRILTRHAVALDALLGELLFRGLNPQHDGHDQNISQKKELEFLGSNNNRILFIVHNSEHVYFAPEAEKAFLKTLQALNLRLDDVAVLNICNADISTYKELKDAFNSKQIIFLDCPDSILPETPVLTRNEILEINQTRMLHTYSFDAMLLDLKKKKQFWLSIKKMFPAHG